MNVTLYKYADKPIIVDKTNYLNSAYSISGEVPEAYQDMERPTLYFAFSSEPEYNYAYVAEYHRYYFITRKTWISGNLWQFDMAVDELYTYRALVRSLDGIVAYSASGSPLRFDPRLVYNQPPVLTTGAPASTLKNSGTPYYVISVEFFASGSNYMPTNSMRYYIMPQSTFKSFIAAYVNLSTGTTQNQQLATAIGNCIKNVAIVYWLNLAGQTAITTGKMRFDSPEINMIQGGGTAGGYELDITAGASPTPSYYLAYSDTIFNPSILTWMVSFNDYHVKKARRTMHIPFVGDISLDLDNMGAGAYNVGYYGASIRYEFSCSSYVVTPGYSSLVAGPNTLENIFPASKVVVSNQYETPFVTDKAFENSENILSRQALGTVSSMLGGAVSMAMTQGLTAPLAIAQAGSNVAQLGITASEMGYKTAANMSASGSFNGGSPDNVYYTEDSNYNLVPPSAFLDVLTYPPSDNYASFQQTHGYPDGAFRSLSNLSGYVQMQEFEMIYAANATKGEMERLEAQLKAGVIL